MDGCAIDALPGGAKEPQLNNYCSSWGVRRGLSVLIECNVWYCSTRKIDDLVLVFDGTLSLFAYM